ncbi:MAG TPA: hypothetical protein VGM82_12160 [Gemmatimonadaceae bacterium]
MTLCLACHATNNNQELRRLDRSVITRDEMLAGHYATVYDAVAATRSMWLQPRGPDSFLLPTVVWVYVDGVRLGGIDAMKTMQPQLVNTVRFYDGAAATSRWGVDHGAGVIHISTWSTGAPGLLLPDSTRKPTKPPPPDTTARDLARH